MSSMLARSIPLRTPNTTMPTVAAIDTRWKRTAEGPEAMASYRPAASAWNPVVRPSSAYRSAQPVMTDR